MSDSTEAQIRHIYEEWHAGTNSHDVPRVIALFSDLPARTADPAVSGSLSRHRSDHHRDVPGRNGARVGR